MFFTKFKILLIKQCEGTNAPEKILGAKTICNDDSENFGFFDETIFFNWKLPSSYENICSQISADRRAGAKKIEF